MQNIYIFKLFRKISYYQNNSGNYVFNINRSGNLSQHIKSKINEPAKWSENLSCVKEYAIKVLFSAIIAALIFYGIQFIKTQVIAINSWNYAFNMYNLGSFSKSIEDYEKALRNLHHNGHFLTCYGKALSMSGKHDKAITVLQEAGKYFPNTVVYTALGDSYKALGQYIKAENAYFRAWYMVPSRFYPKYLLARLYDQSGQKAKAVKTAKELLIKDIKIESIAIEEIKEEMQKIIDK